MAEKSKKPYASYPLYAHAKGSWAKKILGKVYYFGPWSDPNGALESYLAKRDYLRGGFDPPEVKATVGDLLDSFLEEKRAHLVLGDKRGARAHFGRDPDGFHNFLRARPMLERGAAMPANAVRALCNVRLRRRQLTAWSS